MIKTGRQKRHWVFSEEVKVDMRGNKLQEKKTTGTAALQSRENQRLLTKGRISKAGGDLAGGREAENQSDQPQSVLKGRLEPGGSLEERS